MCARANVRITLLKHALTCILGMSVMHCVGNLFFFPHTNLSAQNPEGHFPPSTPPREFIRSISVGTKKKKRRRKKPPLWNVFFYKPNKQDSSSTGTRANNECFECNGPLFFPLGDIRVCVRACACGSFPISEYTQKGAPISSNYAQRRRESRTAFLLSTTSAQVSLD